MFSKQCLKHATCGTCSLAKGGAPNRIVHSSGTTDAQIAIVGESPTNYDVTRRALWQSESGEFVKQLLEAVNISNRHVYYANALLCNYPSGTKPGKRVIAACRTRLMEELKCVTNLRVIIAHGAIALQSLLGVTKITEELYNIHWNAELHAYIIPTYHPAFIMRNIEAFEEVAWAYVTAKHIIDTKMSGPLKTPTMRVRTVRTQTEAVELLREIASISVPTLVCVDTESDDAKWIKTPMLAIGFCISPTEVITIPWIYEHNPPEMTEPAWDFYVTDEMEYELERIATNANLCFVMHNGAFDIKLLLRNTGTHFPLHEDTMLLHYAMDERGGADGLEGTGNSAKIGSHRLKTIAKKYLLIPDWEKDIKRFLTSKKVKYSYIPRKKLHEYLSFDVVYCYMLVAKLKEVCLDENPPSDKRWKHPLDAYYEILIPAQNELIYVEYDGVRINEKERMKQSTTLRKKINTLYEQMIEYVRVLEGRTGPPPPKLTKLGRIKKNQPLEFNPRSPQDLKKLIYTTLKVQLTQELKTSAKGTLLKSAWPTGRDVLNKLKHIHPIIDCLIQYKLLNKEYGTYVRPLPMIMDERGHIHAEFLLIGTRTGRLSSKNPNLQNLKKDSDIKKLYAPDAE